MIKKNQPEVRAAGFTMLELMIVLAILSVLALIATQTYPTWMNLTKTSEATDSFSTSIAYARGEAIASGGNVSLCASNNGTACSGSLNQGWLVYHDTDDNGALSGGDKVLHWVEQRQNGVQISAVDPGGNSVSEFEFNHRGYPTSNLTVSIQRKDSTRNIVLHKTGRVEAN